MIHVFKKMLALLSNKEKKQLVLIFSGLVFMAFLEMAGIASIMPFMAVVSSPDLVEKNKWLKYFYETFNFNNKNNYLIFLGTIVLFILIVSNLFKALMVRFTLSYDNRLNYLLARRLLASYLSKSYCFFLNRNTADLGKNILNEVRTVISGVLSPSMKLLSGCLISSFILALLLLVNPVIAVTIAIVLGGAYAALFLLIRRRLSVIGKEQLHASFMKFKSANEALSGIKDLKVMGRESFFLERFADYAERHALNNVTAGTISQLPRYFLEIMAFGGILLIVIYFLGSDQGAVQMVPLLAMYAFAGYRLMPAIQDVFSSLASVRYSLPALDALYDDLIENKAEPSPLLARRPAEDALPFRSSLELREISFSYPGSHEYALRDVSLVIAPNSIIGFVGTTGSGKTTAVDIILGLLSPTSGCLVVDDVVLDEENMLRWQKNLGYVPQHIYLSDDTITRNIAFGVCDEDIDMDAVYRAAKIANLHQFIEEELSDGYETVVGERGVRLSGGQRQRIGIARAMYSDPQVLILDEATSALDGVTEEVVMDAIRHLTRKKTIIMIAHRLTTVRDCDTIYVMEHGRVVDSGDYNSLQKTSVWFRGVARVGA